MCSFISRNLMWSLRKFRCIKPIELTSLTENARKRRKLWCNAQQIRFLDFISPKTWHFRSYCASYLIVNLAITNTLLYQTNLTTFWPNFLQEASWFCAQQCPKNSYLAISPKVSILGHVLLHNLYINVAIAKILLYSKSLYDLPEPKYQKWPKFHGAMPKKSVFWPYLQN